VLAILAMRLFKRSLEEKDICERGDQIENRSCKNDKKESGVISA
jgi:hypothetical protein